MAMSSSFRSTRPSTFAIRARRRYQDSSVNIPLVSARQFSLVSHPQTPRSFRRATQQKVIPFIRLNSTLSGSVRSQQIDTESQAAYDRLRPIIDALPHKIDWAVAYGSGVKHQANASNGPAPMTDFLVSTSDPLSFHRENMQSNPDHYPSWSRLAGAGVVARVQEDYGAGVWYVTMVNIQGLEVKYGIISTARLVQDLEEWDTLYVAGRMHKPVLSLLSTPQIDNAVRTNLTSAMSTSLLLLPRSFAEADLFVKIAGLSYSGDPRMSVPGAENPEKVKNIVRGPGSLLGFRHLYKEVLSDVGVEHNQEKKSQDVWMVQNDSTGKRARLLANLPLGLRYKIAKHLQYTKITSLIPPDAPIPALKEALGGMDMAAWEEMVTRSKFEEALLTELRLTIRRPALTQSMKGVFTAGLTKSWQYSMAKFRKWLDSGKKPKTKSA